jgi:hypothetical protein
MSLDEHTMTPAREAQAVRRDLLTAFLDARLAEGYLVESRTDTQAIISRGEESSSSFLARFRPQMPPVREVVSVDASGEVTVEPAVPLRS